VQQLLGHSDLPMTEIYIGRATLDELQRAVAGFNFGLSLPSVLANPVEAPTGIEPASTSMNR
jgi:hypothetical protein